MFTRALSPPVVQFAGSTKNAWHANPLAECSRPSNTPRRIRFKWTSKLFLLMKIVATKFWLHRPPGFWTFWCWLDLGLHRECFRFEPESAVMRLLHESVWSHRVPWYNILTAEQLQPEHSNLISARGHWQPVVRHMRNCYLHRLQQQQLYQHY